MSGTRRISCSTFTILNSKFYLSLSGVLSLNFFMLVPIYFFEHTLEHVLLLDDTDIPIFISNRDRLSIHNFLYLLFKISVLRAMRLLFLLVCCTKISQLIHSFHSSFVLLLRIEFLWYCCCLLIWINHSILCHFHINESRFRNDWRTGISPIRIFIFYSWELIIYRVFFFFLLHLVFRDRSHIHLLLF